jgi:hypothetical protein
VGGLRHAQAGVPAGAPGLVLDLCGGSHQGDHGGSHEMDVELVGVAAAAPLLGSSALVKVTQKSKMPELQDRIHTVFETVKSPEIRSVRLNVSNYCNNDLARWTINIYPKYFSKGLWNQGNWLKAPSLNQNVKLEFCRISGTKSRILSP